MMDRRKDAEHLLGLIEEGVSPFHVVDAVIRELVENGFEELSMNTYWGLDYGGKYYVNMHDSTLFAFTIGENTKYFPVLKMSAAHTDFPSLRIKTDPEIVTEGYKQLNVEVYGGPILNTWFDRPLSVAGRVSLRADNPFRPEIRLVDFKKPILTIPNLAIHMNRDVNKGVEINRQTDLEPLLGLVSDSLNEKGYFIRLLARKLHVDPEDILDFELNLYNTDTGDYVGSNGEFISAPRLDNLTGAAAILTGLIEAKNDDEIHIAAFFDHEEIGSKTKQGAGSAMLSAIVERIGIAIDLPRENYLSLYADSMLLSVDVGHAVHPNYTSKSDPTVKAILGKGMIIKEAASQSYATDCEAIGIVQMLCEKAGVPYQKVANRSDIAGGSTLGSIASAMLPVRTVDIGVPLLAMHSARELMGTDDQEALCSLIRTFYSVKAV